MTTSPPKELRSAGVNGPGLPYKDLKPDELRLLAVYPAETADKNELIRCSLEHFSLTLLTQTSEAQNLKGRYEWGDYVALSYCWGWDAQSPSCEIIIDGQVCKVTESLQAALQSIRISDDAAPLPYPMLYWVDAVCINQSNTKELQREILRMRDIYSHAMTVFVHLGPEIDDSDIGFKFLQRLSKDLASGVDVYEDLLTKRFQSSEEDQKVYMALLKILCRPYWSRVWVIQELAVCKAGVHVGCGRHKVPLDHVHPVATFVALNAESIQWILKDNEREVNNMVANMWLPTTMWVISFANEKRVRYQQTTTSLKRTYLELRQPLLTLAQNAQATKSHDNVYGLLGLMPNEIRDAMEPYIDYALPVNVVFTAFSRAIIEYTGELDIIHAKNTKQTMKPSWATDWRMLFDRAGFPHHWLLYCYDKFDGAYPDLHAVISLSRSTRADRGFNSTATPIATFLDTPHTLLKCSGTLISTIDGIAPEVSADSIKNAEMRVPIQPTSTQGNPYGDEKATVRALLHTLFANPFWGENADEPTSLLHIPWLAGSSTALFNSDGELNFGAHETSLIQEMVSHGWQPTLGNGFFVFEYFRRSLSHFRIAGRPFSEYFDQKVEQCAYPPERIKLDIATCLGAYTSRKLVTLETGHFGLAPCTVKRRDSVFVLVGCSIPVVLRPVGETGHFEVVGECYVEGMMDGEAFADVERDEFKMQDIVLC